MITREQVADLQPGDVVELTSTTWPDAAVRGRLRHNEPYKSLVLNSPCGEETYVIRNAQGGDPSCPNERTLTVVSRAPRPLYVNHPRTEAREHDVVRDGAGVIRHHGPISDTTDPTWWSWEVEPGFRWTWTSTPPQPLTLLVDGETGQVVP